LIAKAETGKIMSEVVETLALKFLHRNRYKDEALKRIVRDMTADTGVEAFVRKVRTIMSRPDSRPLLASIGCPTSVLTGDGDELTPPDLAKESAGAIAGARLVIVPDSGHLSTLERPDAVNAAMEEWLGA
jgi:pimeloyl-ACP methyl ester carboxylesterase